MTAYREWDIIGIATGDITECEDREGVRVKAIFYPDTGVVTRVGYEAAYKCDCLTCASGYPNPGGYRPHTLKDDCWCIGANYFGQCEIDKDFPEWSE